MKLQTFTVTSVAAALLLLGENGCSMVGSTSSHLGVGNLRIGRRMPSNSSVAGIAHRGRELCTHWTEVTEVTYNFDVLCGSGKVVYIQVSDPQFRTPGGLGIGEPLNAALREKGTWKRIEGSCGVSLPSGWIARAEAGAPRYSEGCGVQDDVSIAYFEMR